MKGTLAQTLLLIFNIVIIIMFLVKRYKNQFGETKISLAEPISARNLKIIKMLIKHHAHKLWFETNYFCLISFSP